MAEVCRILGTTSRTLRYYEQLGFIKSVRTGKNAPRQFDEENIDKARKVLLLRSLSLSLEDVGRIVVKGEKAAMVLKENRNMLFARMDTLRSQLRLLEEVMTVAEKGGNIFEVSVKTVFSNHSTEMIAEAGRCTESLLGGNTEYLFERFCEKMKEYLPADVLKTVWNDTISGCGSYESVLRTDCEENIVTDYLIFEKTGISVKYVFNGGEISGLWFNYFER